MFNLWRWLIQGWQYNAGRKLLVRAFHKAECHDYVGASELLERASEISPKDSSIWNELAFCHGKMGNAVVADRAARKAIELEPTNPKFRVSLVGLWLDEAWKLTNRSDLDRLLRKVWPEMEALLKLEAYASGLLAKALFLAFDGKPEPTWSGVLREAYELYLRLGKIPPVQARAIVEEQRKKCNNAARMYEMLSRSK